MKKITTNILGYIGLYCTIYGLYLNSQKNILCWPIWLIGDICWIVGYVPRKEWPVVVTNSIFVIMNVWGWWSWSK